MAGIHVMPVRTVLGSSELCEVFLDPVRDSMSARVGAENDGRRVTQVPPMFERGTALVGEVVDSLRLVEDLAPLADAGDRRELGRCASELVEKRLRTLALTIAAGSSQIQRNIVVERVCWLPEERPWTST